MERQGQTADPGATIYSRIPFFVPFVHLLWSYFTSHCVALSNCFSSILFLAVSVLCVPTATEGKETQETGGNRVHDVRAAIPREVGNGKGKTPYVPLPFLPQIFCCCCRVICKRCLSFSCSLYLFTLGKRERRFHLFNASATHSTPLTMCEFESQSLMHFWYVPSHRGPRTKLQRLSPSLTWPGTWSCVRGSRSICFLWNVTWSLGFYSCPRGVITRWPFHLSWTEMNDFRLLFVVLLGCSEICDSAAAVTFLIFSTYTRSLHWFILRNQSRNYSLTFRFIKYNRVKRAFLASSSNDKFL